MAKIEIHHTASDFKSPGSEHDTADRGFQDQWLRALEKAHLESQNVDMGGDASHQSDRIRGDDVSVLFEAAGCDGSVSSGGAQNSAAPHSVPNERVLDTSGPWAADEKGAIGTGRNLTPNPQSTLWEPAPSSPQRSGSRAITDTARSQSTLSAMRRFLPPSSKLTLLVTDDGVQVVIRDSKAVAADFKPVIGKMRKFMDSRKLKLSAVTLNGELLWAHGSIEQQSVIESRFFPEQEINKHF
jgi:hypothetical protein